ncbi:hypothetical protein LguiB_028822 [Lonicera macranthoides]
MHYGGSFTNDGKKYLGGKISYFDYCDEDLMSLLELEDMQGKWGAVKRTNVEAANIEGTQRKKVGLKRLSKPSAAKTGCQFSLNPIQQSQKSSSNTGNVLSSMMWHG